MWPSLRENTPPSPNTAVSMEVLISWRVPGTRCFCGYISTFLQLLSACFCAPQLFLPLPTCSHMTTVCESTGSGESNIPSAIPAPIMSSSPGVSVSSHWFPGQPVLPGCLSLRPGLLSSGIYVYLHRSDGLKEAPDVGSTSGEPNQLAGLSRCGFQGLLWLWSQLVKYGCRRSHAC